ncbi:MAG TPA: LysE family translocator [Ktedonobacteraceae bacterium]|nr:LysE family translocator [Ktedonobacteraceae bacterium]
MPAWTTISLFLLAALGLLLIPGPSVLYVVTRSVDQGRRAGIVSASGICVASLLHTTAAALGLSALLLSSALAFTVVKYLGAVYLIYLGIRTLLRRETHESANKLEPRSLRRIFLQGILVNLLNPKTALFFFAFLPQFVDPARGSVVGQILFFGCLLIGLGFCSDSTYALLAGTLAKWLKKSARFQRVQRYITGIIYIALGLTAAFVSSEKK